MAATALAAALGFAGGVAAQDTPPEQQPAAETSEVSADIRVEARSVLMFNQYLYYGAMDRPRALAIDREHHEVWVGDSGTARVGVYRQDGSELFSFTSKQYLRDVWRLAISPKGDVYAIEADRTKVRRFSYRGEYKGEVALPSVEHKRVLTALTFDGDGNLYVGDSGSAEVFVYTPDLKVKMQFGSRGRDDGQFMSFAGLVVAPDGTIVVCDQQALAVQVFDSQGNFMRGWGKHEMGGNNFSLPSGVALDARGRIYVSDELRHQVKIFDRDGKFLGAFGGLGSGPGQLSFPTDVAVDEANRVYVAERFTARVQVFETNDVAVDSPDR